MRARRVAVLAIIVGAGVLASSCSSSSSTTGAGSGTTVAPNSSCPFSGSTKSQSKPGSQAATKLVTITPAPQGCIDNVTLAFSPSLASSVTGYESTPPAGGGAVLVVTLQHASLGGSLKPTTTNPTNVSYVSKVQLSAPSGKVVLNITLDKVRPFLVSSSKVPAQLVISVG